MKKLLFSTLFIAALCGLAQAQGNIPYGHNPAAGGRMTVNGTQVYYEIYGSGQPLLLLHGNGGSISSRAAQIPEFAKHYRVIAVDSRCHGNSGCPAGDLRYEQMAADINALLDQLNVDSCLIWGHSDGGILALIMGFQYPKKVKRMVVTGANVLPDSTAVFPELVQMVSMYPQIPDTLEQKHLKLMADHPHISFDKLHQISAPVLVMSGDRDAIRPEHTVRIFQAIPNAQLCILPGTTHFVAQEKPALFTAMVSDFFEKPFAMPSTVEIARQMAAEMMQKH